ncbi:hypothetical protein SUGI_0689920 [Cryptomeria japonica]|nr:hypothetical protein SUGI_0689920 [Cryptomeria japonica]
MFFFYMDVGHWWFYLFFNQTFFDSLHGRIVLHYAANYGYTDRVEAILLARHLTSVLDSWLLNQR